MRLFAFFIVSFLWLQNPEAQAYQALKKKIEQTYGIQIEFDNIEFHGDLYGNASATPLVSSKEQRRKSLKNLQFDLSKYSKNLIKKFAKKVYIVKHLVFSGTSLSGSFDAESGSLYLKNVYLGGSDNNATVFHHEFSSLLLYEYHSEDFYSQWVALNPQGFVYYIDQQDGNSALHGEGDIDGHPKFYKKGFVMGYGTSSFQNDFNTFFELMMGDPVRLSKLESKYPAIRKKAELLRKFYYGTVLSSLKN